MARQREQESSAQPGEPFQAPDNDRAALLAEIAELKAKLARAGEAGGRYTPAPATVGHSGPLRPFLVSLDHVHKGLITPSAYFANQARDIVPGRAGEAIRAMGEQEAARQETDYAKELIRTRRNAEATAADAAEQAVIARGRPIMAASEPDAKAMFCRLHGIEGWSGQGPEVRELTAEELETGAWGPPPQPGEKFKQRVAERPVTPRQPTGPTAARDAALAEALAF